MARKKTRRAKARKKTGKKGTKWCKVVTVCGKRRKLCFKIGHRGIVSNTKA